MANRKPLYAGDASLTPGFDATNQRTRVIDIVQIQTGMKMKNRKWICLYGLLCLVMPLFAQQYTVRGGDGEPMLAADETSYKLKVYVVNGVEDITLSYTSSSTSHHWKKYRTRALEAEDIPCQQEGTTSTDRATIVPFRAGRCYTSEKTERRQDHEKDQKGIGPLTRKRRMQPCFSRIKRVY